MALRKWLEHDRAPILVQAFSEFKAGASAEPVEVPITVDEREPLSPHDLEAIKPFRDQFMVRDDIDTRFEYLQSLPLETVHGVLASLSPADRHENVNHRETLADYIGDLLAELWTINPKSYWDHLASSFQHEDGLLLYDSDCHIETMCSEDMPSNVWQQLLKSICKSASCEWAGNSKAEYLARIIGYQTLRASSQAEHRRALNAWYVGLDAESRKCADNVLKSAYLDVIPDGVSNTA